MPEKNGSLRGETSTAGILRYSELPSTASVRIHTATVFIGGVPARVEDLIEAMVEKHGGCPTCGLWRGHA